MGIDGHDEQSKRDASLHRFCLRATLPSHSYVCLTEFGTTGCRVGLLDPDVIESARTLL
jgi:hypothetical protein